MSEEKATTEVSGVRTLSARSSRLSSGPTQLEPLAILDYSDHARIAAIRRRMLWKMDIQVVSIAFTTYFLSFLDRSNIGQARLNGLQGPKGPLKDEHDFLIATTCTYVLYIICEIPSNLLFKVATPRIWIPLLLTLWGLVACLQGFSTNAGGFYVARLALGVAEAGILPGLALWLTYFYKPGELMLRQALYFSGASLSGAFSGLLSTVLARIHTSKYQGWSWIFIIEGAFTCAVGLVLFFIIPSSPKDLFWLTAEERELAITRMETSFGEAHHGVGSGKVADGEAPGTNDLIVMQKDDYQEPFRVSEVWRAILDLRNVTMAVAGFSMAAGLYGMAFFSPTLIKSMNPTFSSVHAQLLSCPPYAVAFVVSIILAIISDRLHYRFPVAVFSCILGIVGFAMAYGIPARHTWARYGALFVLTTGVFSLPATMLSWIGTMNASHTKKATGIALLVVFTNSGGLAATWMWPADQGPGFRMGFLVNTILMIVCLLAFTVLEALIILDRRNKATGKHDHLVDELRANGYSEKRIRIDLGDRHPDFKIML